MEFIREGDNFVIIAEGQGLIMTREEAEVLFVTIGHALQDHDKVREEEANDND